MNAVQVIGLRLLALTLFGLLAAGCSPPPSSGPTLSPTATLASTPSLTDTPTATTPRVPPSPTRTTTATSTSSPAITPTSTATETATPTSTPAATDTPANTATATLVPLPVPKAGHWTGLTANNHPLSFDVTSDGAYWDNFTLTTTGGDSSCSFTVDANVAGPIPILGNLFSATGPTFAFTGQFHSATSASGTYLYPPREVSPCGSFTEAGTWTASAP